MTRIATVLCVLLATGIIERSHAQNGIAYVFETTASEVHNYSTDLLVFSKHSAEYLRSNPDETVTIRTENGDEDVAYRFVMDRPTRADVIRRLAYPRREKIDSSKKGNEPNDWEAKQ